MALLETATQKLFLLSGELAGPRTPGGVREGQASFHEADKELERALTWHQGDLTASPHFPQVHFLSLGKYLNFSAFLMCQRDTCLSYIVHRMVVVRNQLNSILLYY